MSTFKIDLNLWCYYKMHLLLFLSKKLASNSSLCLYDGKKFHKTRPWVVN